MLVESNNFLNVNICYTRFDFLDERDLSEALEYREGSKNELKPIHWP